MSNGIFQSACDPISFCFNSLAYEVVEANACKMNSIIFAVMCLIFCFCNKQRFESMLLMFRMEVRRRANSVSFYLLTSCIESFFRWTIIAATAFLLSFGLYVSLHDDAKAAVFSYLGVAALVVAKCILQGDARTESKALNRINYVSSFLMCTGFFLLLITDLRPTAFYSVCLGIIIHKITLDMLEMVSLKQRSKSSTVGCDNDLEVGESDNAEGDEANLHAWETGNDLRQRRYTALEKNVGTFEQDGFFRQTYLSENKVAAKVSGVKRVSENASSVPPKKRFFRELCESNHPAVIKTNKSPASNAESIGEHYLSSPYNRLSNGNNCSEDISLKRVEHTCSKCCLSGLFDVERNEERGSTPDESGCHKNVSTLDAQENCLVQRPCRRDPVKTFNSIEILKQFRNSHIHYPFSPKYKCETPINFVFGESSEDKETKNPPTLNGIDLQLDSTEAEHIDDHPELVSTSEEQSFECLVLNSREKYSSIYEENDFGFKPHKGQSGDDFLEQTRLVEKSEEVPRRSSFDEATVRSSCVSRSAENAVSSEQKNIVPLKKRSLKYTSENETRADTVVAKKSPISNPISSVVYEAVGGTVERAKLTIAHNEGGLDIAQQISKMDRCSSVSVLELKTLSFKTNYSDKQMEHCNDREAGCLGTLIDRCITSHKKLLLRQYAAEENIFSYKTKLLRKFKSEEIYPNEKESLEAAVAVSKLNSKEEPATRATVSLSFQKDVEEAGCTETETKVSGMATVTTQSSRFKSDVDNVVNKIDLRFIYSLL